ncbi:MAG: maleylacetoacetate isomerase [Allosphingosinicella sp.]|uniref:maleylacetoacetate isomerase n=1 Tax=Allosphingosinicella sp. TaxID=2823234 RepID=UPI003922BE89
MFRPLLHDYFRSSASYRVRIALRLKGVEHDSVSADLRAGDQRSDEYKARNPQGFVPMLEMDGHKLTQSLAIIAYLEAVRPEPRLLPADPADQAHVRAMALLIACDIHPLNNLRVLNYLKNELDHDEPVRNDWYRHWIAEGFAALEALAAPRAGRFLFGNEPTLADVCLVPQMYNARRFDVPLDDYPLLVRVDEEANRLDAFAAAHPDRVAG